MAGNAGTVRSASPILFRPDETTYSFLKPASEMNFYFSPSGHFEGFEHPVVLLSIRTRRCDRLKILKKVSSKYEDSALLLLSVSVVDRYIELDRQSTVSKSRNICSPLRKAK